MTDNSGSGSHKYGNTTLQDSSSAVLGDQYHTKHIYHIQNAHFPPGHFIPVPSGELSQINHDFQSRPGAELVHSTSQHAQDRLIALAEKISTYDAPLAHWNRSCLRIEGTCTWLFENAEFLHWLRSDSVAFTCTGPVGSGKSILAAAAIDHIRSTEYNAKLVAHYYVESAAEQTTTPQEILRALIKQCLCWLKEAYVTLPLGMLSQIERVAIGRENVLSISRVADLFGKLLLWIPDAIYLIDGFDSLSEEHLYDFLNTLRNMMGAVQNTGSKIALFGRAVLGRGIDIDSQLPGSRNLDLKFVNLEEDINRFVDVQMNRFQAGRNTITNPALLQQINETLKLRGQEMFLWIHFQLLTIWNPKFCKCDSDVYELLENLPVGLHDTYRLCLRQIEKNEDAGIATIAFQWVANAKTPLTPRQLQEIVSFRFDEDLLQERMILNLCVTQYCANLLIVDSQGYVRFTHYSVAQLLNDTTKLGESLMKYHLSPPNESACSKLCLYYLTEMQKRQQISRRDQLELRSDLSRQIVRGMMSSTRLLQFATTFNKKQKSVPRTIHVLSTNNASEPDLKIHEYIMRFWLDHTSCISLEEDDFHVFQNIYQRSAPSLWPSMPSTASKADQKKYLVYISVCLDHVCLLHCVIRELSTSILVPTISDETSMGNGVTPLHVAAALGHSHTVRYLLLQDLNWNGRCYDGDGRTPLCYAAENARWEIIRLIVEAGYKYMARHCRRFKRRDTDIYQHLSLAAILAGLPSSSCFMQLVSSGLGVLNWNDTQAMFAACLQGHRNIVNMYCEYGLDMFDLKPFSYPDFDGPIKGSIVDHAIRSENCALLKFALGFLPAKKLLALGVDKTICKETIPKSMVERLFETGLDSHDSIIALNPVVRQNVRIGWSQSLSNSIISCLCGSEYKYLLGLLFLFSEASTDRKYRDILRSIHARSFQPSQPQPDGFKVDLQYLVQHVRVPTNLSDDILLHVCSQFQIRDDFRVQFWRSSLSRHSRRADQVLNAFENQRKQFVTTHWFDLKSETIELIQNLADFSSIWESLPRLVDDTSNLHDAAIPLAAITKVEHLKIMQESLGGPDLFQRRLSLLRLYTIARTLWVKIEFQPGGRYLLNDEFASHMQALLAAGSDGIFDLNFPHGYIMNRRSKYVVKPFIVSAVYRWNWRIRRAQGLPYSQADKTYCPTIAENLLTFRETTDWVDWYRRGHPAWAYNFMNVI